MQIFYLGEAAYHIFADTQSRFGEAQPLLQCMS